MGLLLAIMATACLAVAGVSLLVLYRAGFDQQRERLVEIAQSRARIIETMYEHHGEMIRSGDLSVIAGREIPTTLDVLGEAHERFRGFGETGEFTLAQRDGAYIDFLLRHRHAGNGEHDLDRIPWDAGLAEPMRRALSGHSGTMVGPDYRGAIVLAAHEQARNMHVGIVAKMDLAEVRAPYIRAGLIALGVTLLVVLLGAYFFRRVSDPVVQRLESHARDLENEIAERKSIEVALRESERVMSTLLSNLPGMAYRCLNDPKWPMEFASEGCLPLTGYTSRELTSDEGPDFGDLVNPLDRERLWARIQEGITANRPFEVEYRITTRDGVDKWVCERGTAVSTDFDGNTVLEGFIWDVTTRRQALRELQESEKRFRTAISEAPFPAMIHVEDGEVLLVNKTWFELTGYGGEDIPTISAWAEKAYGDRAESVKAVIDPLYSMEQKIHEGEFEIRTANGKVLVWEFSSVPLGELADGRRAALSMAVDVTERITREEQLRQAQKMEAIGRLAGGVAHDFNNMLNVILGYAEMALQNLEPGTPLHDDLSEIDKAAQRSTSLVHQLLAFSRKQLVQPRPVNLNEVVENQKKMLDRLIGEDISVEFIPGKDLWDVKIDPSQMDQVIANLAVNARDAVDGVGSVTIETKNMVLDESYSTAHLYSTPGEYVMLAFSDSGCGMDEKTMAQVFEPFYTTKRIGEGTGLGLSMVYGIVKQNDGVINVYSEPGMGTTFRIYLPRFTGATETVEQEAPVKDSKGTETILVVEDQPQVLKLTKNILVRAGYRVLAMGGPEAALEQVEMYSKSIDLVLTDVVMPDMNGKDLVKKLESVRPGIRALFMSGYTENVIAKHGVLDDGINFLPKPFTAAALTAKVREVLEG
ncbi:MAG: PAS domain S-box protein [Desulfatibacillaceae bacterium]